MGLLPARILESVRDVLGAPAMSTDATPDSSAAPDVDRTVTVYWRPGCGFCSGLLRSLERHELDFERRNIREDEDAAAFVRAATGGSETVPTVQVGDRTPLVNPSADQVLALVAEVDPDAVPAEWAPREPGRVGRTLNRLLGG